ncbi:conserved Plasmodium protein, unknown function [Plasmodium gallinaceum]|uniref:Uncharacterized protein n=1 Tax=Plasmodium gallinaceum TaxID=5849 RepID=A0A1J1GRV7_PLAGA|nr:conserved Plasmodium protein, unknown function [Plasmodium gallinaceum]CRG93770.1 conserved Plasmodium protein, unknown function [Plasmodium gallinaceum]
MVEINEIEFIEESEYFKFQHGSFFSILEEEKKRKKETGYLESNISNNNFMISNLKQKGFYIFNKNLNIFSLSDFLYKIDNDNSNINIKSLPFEENVLLIENNKKDDLSFIYTDQFNIYIFDYNNDEVNLYCNTYLKIKQIKHIDNFVFLVLSEDEKIYILKDKIIHESSDFTNPINNIDEKNGEFLFSYSNEETFILKNESNTNSYDLSIISKEIDIVYEYCNIICAKILESDKKKKKLFIVVLYKETNDLTSITYDINIDDNEIKRVNYSVNDFFFENFDKKNFIKTVYITEWKVLVSFSSESCEVITYTHNENFDEKNNLNDLKILCIKEGYKINTRESSTFFLSLFIYSKYVDKIYRKSKLGNVPFLKNPIVFFLLQENLKVVVEYLDQFKLEDNSDYSFNDIKNVNENEIKEISLLPPLNNDIIELYELTNQNALCIFKLKELKNEENFQSKNENALEIYQSDNKSNENNVLYNNDDIIKNCNENVNMSEEESSINQIEGKNNIKENGKNEESSNYNKNFKDFLYEDNNFIINKLLPKYNKLIKNGMFLCEDFLYNENLSFIQKIKVPKFIKRKESYGSKRHTKVNFLDTYEKKKKKKMEFQKIFNSLNFDIVKHEKLSEEYCEKIIKKIEKKQKFIFDIKKIFLNDEIEENIKNNKEDEEMCKNKNKNNKSKNEEKCGNEIQIYISKEEMNKFYLDLDSYFLKNKLFKVNKEILDNLKNNDYNNYIFQIIFYNIFLKKGFTYCEFFLYFILKNYNSECFSNSLPLLEYYFSYILKLYIETNKKNNNIDNETSNILDIGKNLLNNNSSNVAKKSYIYDDLDNINNECIVTSCDDDLNNKIYNEDNKKKYNKYVSKIIPLFYEESDKEKELNLFKIMHYSINFLNNSLYNFLSQKLLAYIAENDLNKIDNNIISDKIHLLNIMLNKNDIKKIN